MEEKSGSTPLSTTEKLSPSQSFSLYCEMEFERNRDSDENFEADAYKAAIELTLRRLQLLEKGGYA